MTNNNGRLLAFLFFLMIIGSGVWYFKKDREQLCQQKGGRYIKQFRECFDIKPSDCETISGRWVECGSSCRHIKGELCEDKCETYCQL